MRVPRTISRASSWALPLVVLLLMLLCVRLAYPDDTPGVIERGDALGLQFVESKSGLLGATTALGFLLLGAWLTGTLFKRLHLPALSGYLLFGVLVGPHFVSTLGLDLPALVPQTQLDNLALVNSLAIAFIALTAGGEIRINFFREGFGRVITILSVELVFVFFGVALALFLGSPLISFLAQEPALTILMICLVVGALEVTNSPAVVIAMLSETRADGPMAQTSLALTIFKDLCMIILFTIVSSIALNVMGVSVGEGARDAGEIVMYLVGHLIGSLLCGALIGMGLAAVVRHVGEHEALFVIAAALGIALLSDAVGLEPLLVALAAGFTMVNLWPQRTVGFFHSIERLALPIYCLFFAAAGAKIDLEALMLFWHLALGIVLVRAVLILVGTWAGATLAGMRGPARNWLWTSLIPQAGVSIALIISIEQSFSEYEWSVPLASVLLTVVAIHELFGPMLMKLGLARAGELDSDD